MEKLFNRETSLLEFNARVLAEGMDPDNPLLERLKFIGIVSSNLDEFFQVRAPRLGDDATGEAVRKKARQLIDSQYSYFVKAMVPELAAEGIVRVEPPALTERQYQHVHRLFHEELFPVLTPIALRDDAPPPALTNLRLYFSAMLRKPGETEPVLAVAEVPGNFPRMIALPSEKGYQFLLAGDLVSMFAEDLFPGCSVIEKGLFRLTRAADLSLNEEEDEDFLKTMEEAVRQRRTGRISRIEMSCPDTLFAALAKKLDLKGAEIYQNMSWLNLKNISQFAFQPGYDNLKRPQWEPKAVSELDNADDIFEEIKKKDSLLHVPYESFAPVIRLITDAASDHGVMAIKMTLYRAGANSAIVNALERAALNGKQVTVLVELKARFDEENNIGWARRLESAGATVLYGLRGLKTHAKALLIVRREAEGIRRYCHLGTGNYNEKTARLYSDLSLFTAREDIANDMSAFFNMITGYSQPLQWRKVETAPFGLRRKILRLIEREALGSTPERPGQINAKMNSLVDQEIIEALYKASRAGVKIRLNVRGICCLRPGLKDLSENIEVVSVVDQFLEHARILHVKNAGEDEVYLSSADWMPRNLDRRIELMFPVEDKENRREIIDLMGLYFKDNEKAWTLHSDGKYRKETPEGKKRFRVQQNLCQKAKDKDKLLSRIVPQELKPQKAPSA